MYKNTCQAKKYDSQKKFKNLLWPLLEAAIGNMTHEGFAKKVGLVQRNYLSNYKSGKSTPSDETIERIIEALNIKPTDAERLRSAAKDDRIARRDDNATIDLLLKQDIESTHTQEDTEIVTVAGGSGQINSIEKGMISMGGNEDTDYEDELRLLVMLRRKGVSADTITKALVEMEDAKTGRTAQNQKQMPEAVAASK